MIPSQLRVVPSDALQALSARMEELSRRARSLEGEFASLIKDIERYRSQVTKEVTRRDVEKTAAQLLKELPQRIPTSVKARCDKSVKLLHAIKQRGEMATEQIARYVGVSTYTVQRWEAGKMGPSGVAMRMLHRLLQELSSK